MVSSLMTDVQKLYRKDTQLLAVAHPNQFSVSLHRVTGQQLSRETPLALSSLRFL